MSFKKQGGHMGNFIEDAEARLEMERMRIKQRKMQARKDKEKREHSILW
jgi:hypothetical protein